MAITPINQANRFIHRQKVLMRKRLKMALQNAEMARIALAKIIVTLVHIMVA